MKVEQIYKIINTIYTEATGKSDVVNEDLTNIVDVGKNILEATDIDKYVNSLIDHIGKVVFVNRKYSGNVPSVLMDGWEYGSVREKITMDSLPEASENDSWDLVNGKTYSQEVFYKPNVSAKFFDKKVTFEIPMSFTETQVKSSFSSAEQLNGFMSMIYNAIDTAMTARTNELIMRTINNMIGETFKDAFPVDSPDYTEAGNAKCVNLLKLYNTAKGTTLKASAALSDPDFIRYSSYIMGLYKDRLSTLSTLFNIGKKERFTNAENLTVVMLSNFAKASDVFLQSDTFHNELVKLPTATTVPYWQGSGSDYDVETCSSIDVSVSAGTVKTKGILAVMFDHDAVGVTNYNKRVTSFYNAKAEFINNYYKMDSSYFNDMNENFVVFYIA